MKLQLEIITRADGSKALYFPFISRSDIHWGTRGSKARKLSHFFQHTQADVEYYVGDIVDGEHLLRKRKWNMGPWHRQGMGHVLRRAANGTDVGYIFGNHEVGLRGRTVEINGRTYEKDRTPDGKVIYGVRFSDRAEYTDPQGQVIDIEHLDRFDNYIYKDEASKKRWYKRGDIPLSIMYGTDHVIQLIPCFEHVSVAAAIKRNFNNSLRSITKVDAAIARELDSSERYDGKIGGHTHIGGFTFTPDGKMIMNDGTTVGHVQGLMHDREGNWALIEWHYDRIDIIEPDGNKETVMFADLGLDEFLAPPKMIEDEYTLKADRMMRLMFRFWPAKDRAKMRTEIKRREDYMAYFESAAQTEGTTGLWQRWRYQKAARELPALQEAFRTLPVARVPLSVIENRTVPARIAEKRVAAYHAPSMPAYEPEAA